MVTDLLSVIIRFHDSRFLTQLDEALFSLSTQTYSKLQVVLMVQNGEPPLINQLKELIGRHPFETVSSEYEHKVLSVTLPSGIDGRSRLLNEGIAAATGQYLAFLDYDDAVYPESYRLLIHRIAETKSPIAVGGCTIAIQRWVSENTYVIESKRPYLTEKKNQLDLFSNNFIPIHTFVIDRSKVDTTLLHFNPELRCFEDYEVLLRLASRYLFDFEHLETPVAEYRIRDDGTNTIPTENSNLQVKQEWDKSRKYIQTIQANLWVQTSALEIAKLVQQRDQLLIERKALSFQIAALFVAWTGKFPRLKSLFFSGAHFAWKNLRRIRIFIFRAIRYND